MNPQRIFRSSDFLQPADGEPIRSVITETAEAVIVAWHIQPGQRLPAHVHPHGQDSWTLLSGTGQYQLEADGSSRPVRAGDVVIAPRGCVHGVYNDGTQPLVFISVVAPAQAGYARVDDAGTGT